MELEESGFLKENHVRLIGTTSETIKKAEDRLEFKATMEKIGEPVAASLVVENVPDGLAFANEIGYPVVLRLPTHWAEAAAESHTIPEN